MLDFTSADQTTHRQDNPSKSAARPYQRKKCIRVLGITLDRHLSFRDNFTSVKEGCRSRLNLTESISRQRTRSDRDTRLRVVDAIITSRLHYGIEITCRAFDEMITYLSLTYNNSIRAVSGLIPSTSSMSACIEAGVLPLRHKAAVPICCRAVRFLEHPKNGEFVCFVKSQINRALNLVARSSLPR